MQADTPQTNTDRSVIWLLRRLSGNIESENRVLRASDNLERGVRNLGAEAWITQKKAIERNQSKKREQARQIAGIITQLNGSRKKTINQIYFDECFTTAVLRGVPTHTARQTCVLPS
ncbi:uncharacterized protein LOC104265976 [Ciona intestinalis]